MERKLNNLEKDANKIPSSNKQIEEGIHLENTKINQNDQKSLEKIEDLNNIIKELK